MIVKKGIACANQEERRPENGRKINTVKSIETKASQAVQQNQPVSLYRCIQSAEEAAKTIWRRDTICGLCQCGIVKCPLFCRTPCIRVKEIVQVKQSGLDETAETEVFLNDDIVDCSHDESDLGGIGGASEVGVDLLRLVLV